MPEAGWGTGQAGITEAERGLRLTLGLPACGSGQAGSAAAQEAAGARAVERWLRGQRLRSTYTARDQMGTGR